MSVTADTLQRMNAIIKTQEVAHSVSVIGAALVPVSRGATPPIHSS